MSGTHRRLTNQDDYTGPQAKFRPLIQTCQKQWPADRPLVSVIVPCFNYGKYLESAIDSILAQTFQNLEIIVVESGSTDGITPAIVKGLKLPKTRVFMRKRRHFAGDNRNFGIKQAQGKYMCCLDPDDTLEPTYLEKALFLLECANYDIVSASYRCFGERDEEITIPARPTFAQVCGGASMPSPGLFRKQFWARAGGFRDTGVGNKHIPEDWDFLVRAAGLGARLYNLQESLLNVRWHSDSLNRNKDNPSYEAQRQFIRRRNHNLLHYKNFDNFVKRNETVFIVSEATKNLISRQSAGREPGLLIIPPAGAEETEIKKHAEVVSRTVGTTAAVVLSLQPAAQLPASLHEQYLRLTPDLFYAPDITDDPSLKVVLLEYLLQSRNVTTIIDDLSIYAGNNLTQLFGLYDRLQIPSF